MSIVTVSRSDGIAVVTVDNPPVSTVSAEMRGELRGALARRQGGGQAGRRMGW